MNAKILPSLKAMAESKVEGIGKVTTFNVDARLVEFEEGFNGRPIDQAHVDSFKETKRNGGTWPDIIVRVDAGRIICVEGHHRVVAQCQLTQEDPTLYLPGLNANQFRGNDADRVMLMITTQQGKPLTPLQLGVQYKKMTGFGWKVEAIAARAGKSAFHVREMIKLAGSDSDVQTMVTNGEVAAHVAVAAVKRHGSKAGAVLGEQLQTAKAAGKTKVTNATVNADKVSLVDAIKREMQNGGAIRAESFCPEHADLIAYLRGTK